MSKVQLLVWGSCIWYRFFMVLYGTILQLFRNYSVAFRYEELQLSVGLDISLDDERLTWCYLVGY